MDVLALALCVLLLAYAIDQRWRRISLQSELSAALKIQQDLQRLLRLTASDLRAPVLGLLGHAAHVGPVLGTSLVAVCRDMLDTAEALQAQTEAPGSPRTLRSEPVALGRLLEFVVTQVTAQLGPGQRAWRIDAALAEVTLRGDRRALHQVLLRLLSAAALATGEGDRIAITAEHRPASWALIIEDEGTGLAVPHIEGVGPETRGLGVGLALVRSLMRAHGGSLSFDSTSLVGTRTVLEFPHACVEQSGGTLCEEMPQPGWKVA